MPTSDRVQRRADGWCTTLKFEAWKWIEYYGILMIDSDVYMYEDPSLVMTNLCEANAYFVATSEDQGRGWDGLNTHIIYITPDRLLNRFLRDKAGSGDFVAFTNTEQDSLETLYNPTINNIASYTMNWPNHTHKKLPGGLHELISVEMGIYYF